jgi:hypothetical protein
MGIGKYNFGEMGGLGYLGMGIGEGLSSGAKNAVNAYLAVKQLKNQQKYADLYGRMMARAEAADLVRSGATQPPNVPGSPNYQAPTGTEPPQLPDDEERAARPSSFSAADAGTRTGPSIQKTAVPAGSALAQAPQQAKTMLASLPSQTPAAQPGAVPQAGAAPAAGAAPMAKTQPIPNAQLGQAQGQPVNSLEEARKFYSQFMKPEEFDEAIARAEAIHGAEQADIKFKAIAHDYLQDEHQVKALLPHQAQLRRQLEEYHKTSMTGSPEYQRVKERLQEIEISLNYHEGNLKSTRERAYKLAENGKDEKGNPTYDPYLKGVMDRYFGEGAQSEERAVLEHEMAKRGKGYNPKPSSPMFMPGSGGRGGSQRKMSGPAPVGAAAMASQI